MDGNGRWANGRGLPRIAGHRQGVSIVRSMVEIGREIGVEVMTFYTFSSENWRRPPFEVTALMELLVEAIDRELEDLKKNRVSLRIIGELENLPEGPRKAMERGVAETAGFDGLILVLALSYSGRREIVRAVNRIVASNRDGAGCGHPAPTKVDRDDTGCGHPAPTKVDRDDTGCGHPAPTKVDRDDAGLGHPAPTKVDRDDAGCGHPAPFEIDEATFGNYLDTAGLPDPDLLIRTAGEMRLSNFLLYQLAYTEIVVTQKYWPEFDRNDLFDCIRQFQSRERRFGMTSEQVKSERG